MYLKTLGGLELLPSGLSRPKPLLLLAYLALEGVKERRHLCELFYRDAADPRASLRVALRRIRVGAQGAVRAQGAMVGAAVPTDALEFLAATERRDDPKALELYGGPFLEGVSSEGWGFELEEWVLGTREYLASLSRQAMLRRAESLVTEGDPGAAAVWAERAYLLPAAPPPEPEQLEHMYRLLSLGGSARAPRLRQEIEELGIRLGPIQEGRRLTEGSPEGPPESEVPNNLPAPVTSFVGRQRELEEIARHLDEPRHRLLTLLGAGGVGKTRLALEFAHGQLERERWDGVYFVALDALTDAAVVPLHIARALSYRHGEGDTLEELLGYIGKRRLLLILDNYEQLVGKSEAVTGLLQRCPNLTLIVTSREPLRLAAESVYPLQGLPVPQGVAADPTAPDGPDLGASVELFVERARSADLRFRCTPENVADIVEICRLVEGAPLGIELAAAWVRAMPLHEIARRLGSDVDSLVLPREDVPERQRSLRAAFEHSWRLLSHGERTIFARLSVFRGGFRREDAARVTGASIPTLAALADKSLLRASTSGRFDRHALLYGFAAEKLAERPSEQRSCEARHAHHFLKLAEEAEPGLRSAAQAHWLQRLDDEMDNFRAALSWSLRHHHAELGLRLAGALALYWYLRSSFDEGRRWLEQVLALPRLPDTRFRAKALHGAGRLARSYGDFPQARSLLGEGLELSQRLADLQGAVRCLNDLGVTAAAQADYGSAIEHFERARALASDLGDAEGLIPILSNLGLFHSIVGHFDLAVSLLEGSLALSRAHGDERATALTLNNLALVATRRHRYGRALELYDESFGVGQSLRDQYVMAEALLGRSVASRLAGEAARARVHLRRSLELYLDQNDRLGVVASLGETASLAVALRETRLAVRLWGAIRLLRSRLRFPMEPFVRDGYEEDLGRARRRLAEDAFATAWAEGELWSLDEAAARALAWLGEP